MCRCEEGGGGKEGCEEGIVCQESTYGGMLPTETEVKMYKMLSRKFHYVMQDHCWNWKKIVKICQENYKRINIFMIWSFQCSSHMSNPIVTVQMS